MGYELIEGVVPQVYVCSILEELRSQPLQKLSAGIRSADKRFTSIKTLLSTNIFCELAKGYLKQRCQLVRAIVFDKNEVNNWSVNWHQDRTVAVSKRFNQLGWGPWSSKEGVAHVQPPLEVLNQMLTF